MLELGDKWHQVCFIFYIYINILEMQKLMQHKTVDTALRERMKNGKPRDRVTCTLGNMRDVVILLFSADLALFNLRG